MTNIRRYKVTGADEEWVLTQSAQHDGLPTEVIDDASHDIDHLWDDLGRKVKQWTREASTRYLVYDEAGNLVTRVEAYGTADQQTTSYTYDTLNRLTATNTGDAACYAQGGAEIGYTYDALPGGVSCPGGSTCANLAGRLAYVKTVLWCDDAKADDTFDQVTFYSYDEAGRITEHTVVDDASRTARTAYTYDDNGNVTRIDYPAGASSGVVYDYATSSYGTDDQPSKVKRDTTNILRSVRWEPAGKLDYYQQSNGSSSRVWTYAYVNFSYNLAQRLTDLDVAAVASELTIDYAEDVRGRYTQRVFGADSGAMRDMYFLYDELSRVTCRRTTSGSTCPTSGTALGENISYNTSADRSTIYLRNGTYTDQQFNVSYYYDSDKPASYSKVGGNYRVDYYYDYLGNRTRDNDTQFYQCSNPDQREYFYDGRNNLTAISSRYYLGGSTWHAYTISYAYDEKDRMVFKSFTDTTSGDEAQWFFYWDLFDRLIQVKHVPDITDQNTYSVFQWYWLENRPFLYYQIDYPAATTTRRYLAGDEQGRPLAAWSWPSSGNTSRVWEVDPGLFGWDEVKVGANVYQPIRFPGQLYDEDSESFATPIADCTAGFRVRPGISYNHHRSYDPFTGTYLQVDPKVDETWEPYTYVGQNPVMLVDPRGEEGDDEDGYVVPYGEVIYIEGTAPLDPFTTLRNFFNTAIDIIFVDPRDIPSFPSPPDNDPLPVNQNSPACSWASNRCYQIECLIEENMDYCHQFGCSNSDREAIESLVREHEVACKFVPASFLDTYLGPRQGCSP